MRSMKDAIEAINLAVQDYEMVLAGGVGATAREFRDACVAVREIGRAGYSTIRVEIQYHAGREVIEWTVWTGKQHLTAPTLGAVMIQMATLTADPPTSTDVADLIFAHV